MFLLNPIIASLSSPYVSQPNPPLFLKPWSFRMLHYAIVFLVIALIAAVFGFGGVAAGAAGIAKVLFVVFLIGAINYFFKHSRRRV
jgi:uncharacterized membrane protein YtjA (UPF0391 family)